MATSASGSGGRLDAILTRWSQIRKIHATDRDAQAGRSALVLRYAKAIRAYVGELLKNQPDADKLAQQAVSRMLKGDFAGADPSRGQFRDLLKTAARNMVRDFSVNQHHRQPADFTAGIGGNGKSSGDAWLDLWTKAVLDHAWASLKDTEKANPKKPAYTLLKLRMDFPDSTPEELAFKFYQKFGISLRADMLRQTLHRARLMFAESLIDEIRVGLDDPSPPRVQEELAALGMLDEVREFLPELGATS